MRGKTGNILDSIVNIYVAAKYPWQLRQRFIKYEDRKVQPSTRWGLAEHDQVIYRLYKEITWLILGAQQSVGWVVAALQMLQVLWKKGKIHLGGKTLVKCSSLLYKVPCRLCSVPVQLSRSPGRQDADTGTCSHWHHIWCVLPSLTAQVARGQPQQGVRDAKELEDREGHIFHSSPHGRECCHCL